MFRSLFNSAGLALGFGDNLLREVLPSQVINILHLGFIAQKQVNSQLADKHRSQFQKSLMGLATEVQNETVTFPKEMLKTMDDNCKELLKCLEAKDAETQGQHWAKFEEGMRSVHDVAQKVCHGKMSSSDLHGLTILLRFYISIGFFQMINGDARFVRHRKGIVLNLKYFIKKGGFKEYFSLVPSMEGLVLF